ncbi:MAG: SMI1/KNR4 family protein [Oscillatoria sp. SIO1A7]|nr:SMI1/KNR4 family protein [Oscillatoria sp. SIO1A7]
MSNLNDGLQRIMNWLQKNQPKYAASFLPGLKHDEIKVHEEELGFKLPEEIYELYLWRNGTLEDANALFFTPMQYLPLAEAVSYSRGWNKFRSEGEDIFEQKDVWYIKSPQFIFVRSNCDYCAIPIGIEKQARLPVMSIASEGEQCVFYTNLLAMILTLADCYETGAYYLDTNEYLCEDECKAAQLLRIYNYDISENALSSLHLLFETSQKDTNSKFLEKVAQHTTTVARFKDRRGVDLLLKALLSWRLKKSSIRDGTCISIARALGRMCDKRAVQLLTHTWQEDRSQLVRKEAGQALSELMELLRIE